MKKYLVLILAVVFCITACTAKPSKETTVKAFQNNLIKSIGPTATEKQKKVLREYGECIVDKSYEKLSAETVKKFVDAKSFNEFKNVQGSSKEKTTLDIAKDDCASKLNDKASK